MARSRVELFEAIRRDERRDGFSVRALADKHGVHRRTVRLALGNAVPPERRAPVRVAPKLDPAKGLIDAMLIEDLSAPRKQRHTARRVLARLVDEHQLSELTYSAVRDYVAKRRPEIWAPAGNRRLNSALHEVALSKQDERHAARSSHGSSLVTQRGTDRACQSAK